MKFQLSLVQAYRQEPFRKSSGKASAQAPAQAPGPNQLLRAGIRI